MFEINASLIAKIQSPTPTGYNPVTGAPIFDENIISVDLSVEEGKPAEAGLSPGIEESAIYLTGRVGNSGFLPAAFIPNRKYDCVINLSGQTLSGKFYLLPLLKGRLGLENIFGQPIAGWFIE